LLGENGKITINLKPLVDDRKLWLELLCNMSTELFQNKDVSLKFHCPLQVYQFLQSSLSTYDYSSLNLSKKLENTLARVVSGLNYFNINFKFDKALRLAR